MAEQNADNPINRAQATPAVDVPQQEGQATPKAVRDVGERDVKLEERAKADRNRQVVREEAIKSLIEIRYKFDHLQSLLMSPDLDDERLFKIADGIKGEMENIIQLGQ